MKVRSSQVKNKLATNSFISVTGRTRFVLIILFANLLMLAENLLLDQVLRRHGNPT